ncbi:MULTISPECIES: hypothetical protein [unclassified Kitasatospora]|uniref:hypothetical protein n=1 Tax=unclassified Kitasatospora TaxID=2633591 RepID=UPI0033EB97F6
MIRPTHPRRTAALGLLLPATLLALAACGSDTPSMRLGRAEEKVRAYATAALAAVPGKDAARVSAPQPDRDECAPGPVGSTPTYLPYLTYDLSGLSASKAPEVFEAVRQRLAQDGFGVRHRDDRRLDLAKGSDEFTASVVLGEPDTAPDTFHLTVRASCVPADKP